MDPFVLADQCELVLVFYPISFARQHDLSEIRQSAWINHDVGQARRQISTKSITDQWVSQRIRATVEHIKLHHCGFDILMPSITQTTQM